MGTSVLKIPDSHAMSVLQSPVGITWCNLKTYWRNLSSLPHYNHGLSGKGKGKFRSSTQTAATPLVAGEVLFGLHPTLLALQVKRRKNFHCVYLNQEFNRKGQKNATVTQIYEQASEQNVPIKFISKTELDSLAGNRPHQGVCLDADLIPVPEWKSTDSVARLSGLPLWLFLHSIQDPMNLGAVLRSAHYLGVDQVVVPSSSSCRLSPVVSKASAGALEVMNLIRLPQNLPETEFCKWWKVQGGAIVGTGVAIGADNRQHVLQDFKVVQPTVVILGNEGSGLGQELESCCDQILTIPGSEPCDPSAQVGSLNVSVAAGILLHWLKLTSQNKR